MRRLIVVFVWLALCVSLVSCIKRRETRPSQAHFERLVAWMTGSFTSQEQAMVDSSFLDLRLQMVQIWPDRTDGRWLYVEQASALTLDKPYRQRVYRLFRRNDTTLVSAVYEFRDPLRMAGAWRIPSSFDAMLPDSLRALPGCALILHPRGDTAFVGSTLDRECANDHPGAAYATTEVKITELGFYSWDRGWDNSGTQVWGTTTGGYMFRRIREP